ncbi:hypothetical protein FE257_001925 [Aspergillus nanangensis]|uniref:Carrier domain-containing protein n=1 Tax=Aspergillus nanangensis TaxID=2582783 RepID=A0AAD4CD49_ASPNN|nr:hypothetical protein FE257_001925 [Aspergillus nanangensis]
MTKDVTLIESPAPQALRKLPGGQGHPPFSLVSAAYHGAKVPHQPFNAFVHLAANAVPGLDAFWVEYFRDLSSNQFPTLPSPDYLVQPSVKVPLTIPIQPGDGVGASVISTRLQLSWALLLSLYTESNDVVFGMASGGRMAPLVGIKDITRPTTTCYPLRVQLNPTSTVGDTLMEMQAVAVQTVPFEHAGIKRIQQVSPDAERACAFQTLLCIDREDEDYPQIFSQDAVVTDTRASNQCALTITFKRYWNSIEVGAVIDPQMISNIDAQRMLQQLRHIYQQTGSSTTRLDELDLICPEDMSKLQDWNGRLPLFHERCMHEVIETQSQSRPDAPAVWAWDGGFSYRELDDHASLLAGALIRRGVGPNVVVPLYFEKTRWTTVAILGVLKAGGAVLMLDPAHPLDRLRGMCRDASSSLILASPELDAPAKKLGLQVLLLGDNEADWCKDGQLSALPAACPENPLYVAFTSGSTGKPKGVVISHRAFCTNAAMNCAKVGLTCDSRVLQFTSHCFDMCLLDHLWTLSVGGCLCIPSKEDGLFQLSGVIADFRATWINLTPSMARTLKPDQIPLLETLALAGEPMTAADVAMWSRSVRLVNMYGPAECAAIATVQEKVHEQAGVNNIGSASSAVTWLVSPSNIGHLMPIGTTGEILIEGALVGEGYLDRPDATAAAFAQPPRWLQGFRPIPGRLYRTGDLARYAADGSLVYIGRKDTQVKLRGQRIELEEVEHHAQRAFTETQQVVAEVITPQAEARGPILLVFVLRQPNSLSPSSPELFPASDAAFCEASTSAASSLKAQLPSYMVPAAFIPLGYVPLSPTGKLNRRLLRKQACLLTQDQIYYHSASAPNRRAPASTPQLAVQQLFAQVLRMPVDHIGLDDDFFCLGGDSMLAIKLVSAANESGYWLSGGDIFANPRLQDLAEKLRPSHDRRALEISPFALLPAHVSREDIMLSIAPAVGMSQDKIQDIYPCSPMQEGLMALSSTSPGAYIETFHYRLHEDVDVDRFRRAFRSVIRNNPILRTRITSFRDRMFQVVLEEDVPLAFPQVASPSGAMRLNDRLLSATMGTDPSCFTLTMHHSIYDGQSIPILWRQLVAAYNGTTLQPSRFNQFIKYVVDAPGWQDYWRSQFDNQEASIFPPLPDATHLPSPKLSGSYDMHDLPTATAGYTLSTALRLAWAMVLSQYTVSNDVIFGTLVDGRRAPFPGVEGVSGPTLTSYPLRVQLEQNASIESALAMVQDRVASAFPYEHAGLQNIRRLSKDAARACDFQCQLGIQPQLEAVEAPLAALQEDQSLDYKAFSSYALVVVCHPRRVEGHQHVKIATSYDTAVVGSDTVARIMHLFEHILRYILLHPQDKTSQVPTASPADWDQLTLWNQRLPQSVDCCLHHIALQASQTNPCSLAVSAWDGDLDYATLASLSSQLAHVLQTKGVRTGHIVPVCFEKSKWAIVAMLGVLSAGAAVTAIDPKHPQERVSQILAQVDPPVIIASELTAAGLPQTVTPVLTVPSLGLCGDRDNAPSKWPFPPQPPVSPNDLAFVIFTSGSTGQPKGILLEHRNLCTSIRAHSGALHVDQPVRGLHFASYAFDASIYEIFSVLSNGGCVCIPSESQRLNGLEKFIQERKIDWAVFSPSTVRILQPDRVPSLHTVVLGGESLPFDIATLWGPRLTLINGYGPAEATICAAGPVSGRAWKSGTIGPVVGAAGWVVRPSNSDHLVPLGVVGELLIEGPVVTRGYLNAVPGGFIEPPEWLIQFRQGEPGRVYLTGDLVRYTEDGSICFVGRKDSQVKLRGQRIELQEVEYAVHCCYPEAKVAVEFVTTPVPVVVAFIEENTGEDTDPMDSVIYPATPPFQSLCQSAMIQLERSLPTYMVPSAIVPVSRLPMTTGGKLDRKWLRMAVASWTQEELGAYCGNGISAHREASGSVELILHQVWADVLNQDPQHFGVDDSFFRLGGDSISAMQIVSLAHRAGVKMTVEQILRCKTISLLSAGAESITAVLQDRNDPETTNVPFALSPIQRLFFERVTAVNHFNQSVVLEIPQLVSEEAFEDGIRTLVEQHSMLRARFTQVDITPPTWVQTVSDHIDGSYVYRKHDTVSVEKARGIQQVSQKSLNIQEGPLLAVDAMTMADGTRVVSFVAHHLIVDTVSWNILLSDLDEIVTRGTLSSGPSVPFSLWLPALTEQTREIEDAAVDSDCAQFSQALDFWELRGSSNHVGDTQESGICLPTDATALLCGRANDALSTRPVELIHAALLYSFGRVFSDRPLPIIWSESHGREPMDSGLDLTRTVGWFTEIWPAWVEDDQRALRLVEYVTRVKDARRETEQRCKGHYLARSYASLPDGFEILFNFNGSTHSQSTARPSMQRVSLDGSLLADMDERASRFAVFDILAEVVDSRLDIRIVFNRKMRHSHAVIDWLHGCQQSLLELASLLASTPKAITRTDFPLLRLSDEQTARFQGLIQTSFSSANLDVTDAYPCSAIQRGMLLSQAKSPKDYMNRVRWRVQHRGPDRVDVSRLVRAWQQEVDRHPVLRSVFMPSCRNDGSTDQVVLEQYAGPVEVIQCSIEDPVQVLAGLEGSALPEMRPPHRLTVCEADDGRVGCFLEISHVIVDGLSGQIILRDLKHAYDRGRLSPSDSVYHDYIAHIQRQQSDLAREYWRQYTDQMQACFFPRLSRLPSQKNGNGAIQRTLPESILMKAFCQRSDTTVALVCQLAWGLVLRAYTGSSDVCCGYLTSGRDVPIPRIHDAVGPFINILLRRMRLHPDKTLLSLLQQLQAEYTESLEHQYHSLADILHEKGQGSQRGLFNSSMSVQRELGGYAADEASLQFLPSEGEWPTEYDLSLGVSIREAEIAIDFRYREGILTEDQPRYILDAFCEATRAIVETPTLTVAKTCLLAGPSNALVTKWNERALPRSLLPPSRTVTDLIQERCLSQPAAPAVCAWDGNFTYTELDSLSGRLAAVLVLEGAGPEVFVPVCFEKSRWTVIAMLAVMKAGAAFILMDPSLPAARLQGICTAARASLLLSSEAQESLTNEFGPKVLSIGDRWQPWKDMEGLPHRHEKSALPENALYAVFTSGSTGMPKGAVIEHRHYVSQALDGIAAFRLGPGSRTLQFSAYTWDVSIKDHLHAMISGSCLCIPSDIERQHNLAEAVARMQANFADITPSVARTMNIKDFPTMQTLLIGGERVSHEDMQAWQSCNVGVAWGPAECTPTSTFGWISCETAPSGGIGFPIRCQIWITDPDNHEILLPVGAVGEIILAGPNVGRGYLNEPEKTDAVFIEPPSWLKQRYGDSAYRAYKTGDLAQYLDDGQLIFIRRKDSQVKVRGQRIELGEIEIQLHQYGPDFSQAVVGLIQLDGAPRPHLVAFLYGSSTSSADSLDGSTIFSRPVKLLYSRFEQLCADLRKVLPSYMIPDVFIPLRCIPLTANGKLDQRIIYQEAESLSLDQMLEYTAALESKVHPSTVAEHMIVEAVANVLKLPLDRVGVNDSFFRLGGDSLFAMQLVAKAQEAGYHMSMANIFSSRQLQDLAVSAQPNSTVELNGVLPPFSLLGADVDLQMIFDEAATTCNIPEDFIEDIYPATALQEGLMVLSTKYTGHHVNQTMYELAADVDVSRFTDAWDSVVARNPILRTRLVQSTRDGMYQVVIRHLNRFHHYEHLDAYEEHRTTLSWTLGAPLVDLSIIQLATQAKLGLAVHHSVYDGVTMALIWEQVQAAYNGTSVPSLPFNRMIAYNKMNEDSTVSFWRSQFTDLQAAVFPALPSPRYVPVPRSSFQHSLSKVSAAKSAFTETTMVQLAWAIIQATYTGSDDVIFGTTVNGRNAPLPGIQQIVGPTIATVPIRVQLDQTQTVQASLAAIQEQSVAMISFEQLGLQRIRELGSDCAKGCDFQCHLGVQPPSTGAYPDLIASETSIHQDYSAFTNYCLSVIYQLGGDDADYVEVVHDDEVLPRAAAQRLIHQFEHVLNQIRTRPELQLNQLDLVCQWDQSQLYDWNKTLPTADSALLHDRVLAHAVYRPNLPAIDAWDGILSYQEIDLLSLGLAQRLTALGITRGSIVALCMDRSKWVTVSMLAILRAGAACAPLDPSTPPGRIEEILSRTSAAVILASSSTQARFPATKAVVMTIPDHHEHCPKQRLANADSLDPGFIIFTSGSTGSPKGILMDHSALCTSIRDHTRSLGVGPNTRGLHFASYASDASIYEIFSVLVNGGCVCIPSEADRMNNLAGFINESHVNWAVFTPSVLNTVLTPDQVPQLKTITLGGEAVTQDVVDIWAHRVNLINGYGPAETTICAAGPVPLRGWITGTIGNVTGGVGWIVDMSDSSRLAPIGAVGELLMEGAVVTRGYLDDAKRTADAYISPPAWISRFRQPAEVGRFYKTGDLMQYTEDGAIRFCGRKDYQVKLHGQRIELAEVEYHTAWCFPDRQEIVAEIVYRDNNPEDPALVAFLSRPAEGPCREHLSGLFLPSDTGFDAVVTTAIKELRQRVPRYLIPSVFLQVATMPRTGSGKIDRRLLRETAATRILDSQSTYRSAYKQPTTSAEKDMCDVWAGVLKAPPSEIGLDDNFFDLGGDSVKALKVCSLARPRGMLITLLDIFQHPTLCDLASRAAKSGNDTPRDRYKPGCLLGVQDPASFVSTIPGVPFGLADVVDVLPTTEFQRALLEDQNATYLTVRLPADIDLSRLARACRGMVALHPSLRTVFLPCHDEYVQIILSQNEFPITYIDDMSDASDEAAIQSLSQKDYGQPVPSGTSHVRVYVLSRSPSQCWLIFRASHAQLDFQSAKLFMNDMAMIYAGQQPQLQAPSFAQWLQYRRDHVSSDATQFWKDYLDGAPLTLLVDSTIPRALPGPVATQATRVFKKIPFPTTYDGITVATLTRAAWAYVLAQRTGTTDLVFGHVVSGRDLPLPHVEEVQGPCVTVCPLRVTIQRSWTVKDLLHHVHQQYIRIMPFTSVDLQQIRQLQPEWPAKTRLCSVCTHQNEGIAATVPLDGVDCPMEVFQHNTIAPFHVVTGPYGDDELFVSLAALPQQFSATALNEMTDMLSETICRFAGDYGGALV